MNYIKHVICELSKCKIRLSEIRWYSEVLTMGKKKKPTSKRGGSRFFKWIRSDLPDEEDGKAPVLLLGVTKISDSPSLSRRRQTESPHHSTSGSGRFFRPPKSKYHRGFQGDDRLEKIRQDLLTHKNLQESHIPEVHSNNRGDQCEKRKGKAVICLTLNCVGACKDCEKYKSERSSNRGSFLFHRPDERNSSLCPSEPYEPTIGIGSKDYDHEIEHRFSEHIPNQVVEGTSSGSRSNNYSVTPKSTERRSLLLSNLNERFRKTLSLDSKQANRVALSLPQNRPQSMVHSTNRSPKCFRSDEKILKPQEIQPKKKRFRPKSFFSLENFFDSKRSDSSSVDDYSSSKYKKFELESDESPIFKGRIDLSNRYRAKEKTPDLLDLPFIVDSVRKRGEQCDSKNKLDKLETHYYRNIGRTVIDAIPKDATEDAQNASNVQNFDDDDVEYIEPIRSNFTSQSTLIIDSKNPFERPYSPLQINTHSKVGVNSYSALSINTDETDIRIPSSNLTISPKSEGIFENDVDSIGPYEIEVKEADLLINRTRDLIVKIMDKSVDSIGSCSLDVDASTDFSDTTSGSLNLLTPSSTASRVRDFTSRLHERAASANPHSNNNQHFLAQASLNPSPNAFATCDHHDKTTRAHNTNKTTENHDRNRTKTKERQSSYERHRIERKSDNLLKPPYLAVQDTSSHRSRSHKKEQKKPSYLNLACSVNGYSNLTTYDSKLRQVINRSREASPIRPITQTYREYNKLVVPVPVSVDKLIVPTFQPHEPGKNLTDSAPSKAHTDPYLVTSPILVYMAAENRQLKNHFLGKMSAATSSGQSEKLHTKNNDEVDNMVNKELTFKSSYSETNITSKRVANGKTESRFVSSESYTIHSTNGISKHVEITKENGEMLTSPMKSFIQQRVERLYGPGALAQGFFNQKRHKNKNRSEAEETISEANKILTEKSLNCQSERNFSHYYTRNTKEQENIETSPNSDAKSPALPVLRHLRPEFRAQLPILSPKKSPGRADVTPSSNGTSPLPLNIEMPKEANRLTSPALVNGSSSIVKRECDNGNGPASELNCSVSELSSEVNNVTLGSTNVCEVKVNGTAADVRDAYYFLKLEKRETERLIQMAMTTEGYLQDLLQNESSSEEILGLLRSAAGKARLLATQKMQQFEGLCYNNINGGADDPFPTTLEDLQGFWDMVLLQVRNVDQLFQQVEDIRASGWRESAIKPVAAPASSPGSAVSPRNASRQSRGPAQPALNEKARLAAEKREADRRAMLEHRRRMVREKQLAAKSCTPGSSREDQRDMGIEGGQEVEIFVGRSSKGAAPQGDQGSQRDSADDMRAS